jgi:hypothetical protein
MEDQLFGDADMSSSSCSSSRSGSSSSGRPSNYVDINAYPLAFLKLAGNIQASGIPSCFLRQLAKINQTIRQDPNVQRRNGGSSEDSDEDSDMDVDEGGEGRIDGGQAILKPVASQFYNYIAHRTASRAGSHYAMKGTVTAAIAGGFSQTTGHRRKADGLLHYCDTALPSERFKSHIDIEDCPSSCRAELVYCVDVRGLRRPTGR